MVRIEKEKAWHEAGHVVVGMLAGQRVESVSIKFRDLKYAARTNINWSEDTRKNKDKLRFYLRYAMAGFVVEALLNFKGEDGEIDIAKLGHEDIKVKLYCCHDSDDWKEVRTRIFPLLELYGENLTQEAGNKLLEDIWGETVTLVWEYWSVVEAEATVLLQEKEMTGSRVQEVWENVMPLPYVHE